MTDATWSQHGEAIDRMRAAIRAEIRRPVKPPPTIAHLRKKHEGEARARELHQGRTEAEYETEMNERIRTIGAEIRAENLLRMRDDVNDKEDDQW